MALIFVLDNEEDFCQLIRRILSRSGHDIKTFSDSRQAVDWLRSNTPELALLNFKHRGVGEMNVLSYIRRSRPEIKTLLITGRASPEMEKKAGELGIRDYLIKPLGIDEIELHINRVLGTAEDGRQRTEDGAQGRVG